MSRRAIKCAVPCWDSNGTPNMFLCLVVCDVSEIDQSYHYTYAKDLAEIRGFSPDNIVYDEDNVVFHLLLSNVNYELFEKDTVEI